MKAIVIGALLGAAAVLPVSAVELKLKWQTGKRYLLHTDSKVDMKSPVPGQGLVESKVSMGMTMRNDVRVHEKGVRVSSAYDAVRMKMNMQGVEMEFDSNKPDGGGGIFADMFKPLLQIKYDSIYDPAGKLVSIEGLDKVQGAAQLGMGKAEIEAMSKQTGQFMPGKPVEVGDTWKAETEVPMEQFGGSLKLVYTLKLESLEENEGREIAKISLVGKMKEEKKEGEETVLAIEAKKATGTMIFDVELGQPIETTTTLDLVMGLPAGVPQAPGAPGKMPMKTTSVQKLLKVIDLPEGGEAAPKKPGKKPKSKKPELTPEERKAKRQAKKEARKARKRAEEEAKKKEENKPE